MSQSILDLTGQIAIITGGGTGIGQAIAVELARAGADITISSRDPAHLETTIPLVSALGRRCLAVPTDIRQEDQIQNMVEKTLDEFGKIDILVNNAGANFFLPAEKLSVNGWNVIVNINLTGTFLCCKAVFETMATQKSGKIVNISSTAGTGANAGAVHYGAAKAGIINLTQSLASAWGNHGIRVNCVIPGPIVTEGARWVEEQAERTFGGIGRPGRPQEVANAVLFMASEASSFISGAQLTVDGGTELRNVE